MKKEIDIREKVLSVKYPRITSWTWHANLFSILENYECTYDWIYSNYIQLFCYDQGNDLFLDFIPRYTAFTDCPWINNQLLKRETISKIYNNDIISFLIDGIKLNNYIYGIFDESVFLGKNFHGNTQKFLHELFIFGYDYKDRYFDIADFTLEGKYSYGKASFEDISKAYQNVEMAEDYLYENKGGILLASFTSKASYQFDTRLVHQTFLDYINSHNITEKFRMQSNPVQYAVFGIDIYDKMIQHFNLLIEDKVRYDVRPLHVLYDHKSLMLDRIEYMIKNDFLKNEDSYYNKCKIIKEKSLMLRNIYIKSNITKDKQLILKIINELKHMKSEELFLYEDMALNIKHRNIIGPSIHKRPDEV